MASISSHLTFVCLFLSLISCLPQSSTSTPHSILKIETFFPTAAQPPPLLTTTDLISLPPLLPPSPAPQPSSASSQSSTGSSQRIILAAVVSSVATTLAVTTLLFLCVQILSSPRRLEEQRRMPMTQEAKSVDGRKRRVKRGREMLRYGKSKSTSKVLDIESVERVQELPLLPSDVRRSHHLQHPLAGEAAIGALPNSSSAPEARRGTSTNSSTSPILPDAADHHALFTSNKTTEKSEFNSVISSSASQRPPPPLPNLLPLPLPPSMVAKTILASMAVPPPPSSTTEKGEEHLGSTTPSRSRTSLPTLPPKPPSTPSKMMEKVALPANPSPAPAPPPKVHPTPPPPPPPPPLKVLSKAEAAPRPQPPRPPPPRRNGSSSSTTTRPPPPELKLGRQRNEDQSMSKEAGIALKPLHWDKVTSDSDHSTVWDNIGDGSFRVNDDLIASLFDNVPPEQHQKSAFHAQDIHKHSSASTSANQGILDPRRSQNIAIVLRSLSVRRQDIIDAVKDGHGLSSDTLDKIRKIAPNDEEHARLLEFAGEDDSGLSDAEAFLRHLITTVPSAFRRVDIMHFVSTFDQELANVKGSIQSMGMACKELRSSELFVKLLEVVLEAGNRMNAGTARGNARAFNLSALKKLSDVKSIDDKTTLLHFVVQQLVRSEGKKCALLNHGSISEVQGEEREQEYMKLGLPVIGGLSVALGNVKKAAAVHYDSLVGSSSTMAAGVEEVKELLLDGRHDDQNESDGFVREMRRFALKAEEEVGLIREEERRVLNLVNRTYEYYQPGVKGSQPMQLFVIVKDFLGMVDQACVDIAGVQQRKRKKALAAIAGRASPEGLSDQPSPVKFPVLPPSSLLVNS